jgi:CBS domain-containing protein
MNLARNLRVECVSRLQPTPPHRLAPTQTVAEAIALLRRQEVGCVLLCQGEQLVGIFTERDLLRRILAPGKPLTTPLGECMSPQPVVVRDKDPISVAVRKMEIGGYRHLPVVDDAGRPVGILSVKRIVHYLVEHFPATIYNLPPDPSAVTHCREREGA